MENPNQSVEIWDQCRKFFSVASDMELYSQGQFLLQHFDRDKVIEQIQKIIQKYEPEINMLGSFENRHVVHNVDFDQKSDIEIQGDLVYLNSHLPLYALLHAGQEELVKRICKELGYCKQDQYLGSCRSHLLQTCHRQYCFYYGINPIRGSQQHLLPYTDLWENAFLSFTLQQQRPQLCKKRVGPACRIKPLAL